MKFKLSFSEYKQVKKSISKMSQKELSCYLESIYKSGYEDGYNSCINTPRDGEMDFDLLMIAVRATEGVGEVLSNRIQETVKKLCFDGK